MHNASGESPANPALALLRNLTLQCYTDRLRNHSWLQDTDPPYEDDGSERPWCRRTFDGLACWDWTPPGRTAVQLCPDFVVGFDPTRFAHKTCTDNGTWFKHPESQRMWTNYTTCVDVQDLDFRNVVNNIYVAGYSVSLAALILSIATFIYFKTLHCTRIRVHLHLFTSFSVNCALWIIWYKTVVDDVTVVQDNRVWCQALHVLTHFFMVTNYMWMFCEGLHLHIALIVVFIKDEVAMLWFAVVGWGVPLVLTASYAISRHYTAGATRRCWMDYSETSWILTVPVLISLVASLVFLVNIVRVLLTKLPINNRTPLAAKKALRAALILVPLFGLHFLLLPLRPSPGSVGENVYQVVSALLTSLQGFCVAILFCFTNHEVLMVGRQHFARYFSGKENIAMTGLTAGESLVHTRANVV